MIHISKRMIHNVPTFNGVSCSAVTACTATGEYPNSTGSTTKTLAERYGP